MSKCKCCPKPATIKDSRDAYCATHYLTLFIWPVPTTSSTKVNTVRL